MIHPMTRSRALTVVVGLGVAGLVVAGLLLRDRGRDRDRAGPVSFPPGSLAPQGGALLGAWVTPPGDFTTEGQQAAVTELEAQLGRRLDINHHFYRWDKPFPTEEERWDLANGRIPMISWGDQDTRRVASGADDDLIRQRADAVAKLGRPVLLRWFWEMDGKRYRSVAHSPQDYVAAWRHLREVFAQAGADNVRWVWCPNASAFADHSAQRFYPGDAEVDWVCADGYDYPWNTASFADLFKAFHAWGARTGKPLMVGEWGAVERASGTKARWLAGAHAALKSRLPRIAAVVYFDADRQYDWRIGTSADSLAAFKAMAADPYFNRRRG
jgi:hypothetical protein